jgi:predicted ATPase/DNA-binding SARP family transcriptional activator
VKVQLLGTLEVLDDVGQSVPLAGAKLRALFTALALRPGQVVSAELLVEHLWGAEAKETAANSLQGFVSKLRRALPGGVLVTRAPGYVLDIPPESVDATRFERLVSEGRKALTDEDAATAAELLQEALLLWRGPALAEFTYEDFAQGAIARLNGERVTALEDRFEADLACGRHSELVAELEAAVAAEPLRERLRRQLMIALYRSGRQADGLRQFQEARRVLGEELGLEPSPELRRLEAAMLAHDPAIEGPRTRTGKDGEPAGNLRAFLTRFIGRQEELTQLRDLVTVSRLVTLVGPGGAGKSRLALEAAAAFARDTPQGAWMVELASVADPSGIAPAMSSALGVADSGERHRVGMSSVDALVSHLSGRSLLVVVDNCEHVIAEVAALIETLLQALPGLRVLATSREPLGVPGESLLPLGPLPLSDALALFADRATAVAPGSPLQSEDQDLVAEVCRRLDGLPLAIELAAARIRALPLAQLAARLDDRFRVLTGGARTGLPRHQTLRAVVDWSYALLFSDEQRLFSRIAVFVGPFTLDDVEAVCADDELSRADIVDLLLRLVDKSLVISAPVAGGEARFTQLQTLWQYGRERLDQSGEAKAMRARHGAYYRRTAEEAHGGLRGAAWAKWRERLIAELGNLRGALDWFIAAGDGDGALSLASGMAWLWFINSEFREGARWLGDALGATGSTRPELVASAQVWHGYFVSLSSTRAAGVEECEAAAAALSTSEDPVRRGEAQVMCATLLMRAYQFGRSQAMLAEARDPLERAGEGWLLAVHDLVVAWNMLLLGGPEEVEQAARSSLERFNAEGETWFSVEPLGLLAGVAEARGDLDEAAVRYESLLERCRATGQRGYAMYSHLCLAALRARQGDDLAADHLYEDAIANSINPAKSADAMVAQAAVARRLGDQARARALLQAAADHYRRVDPHFGQAAVLAGLAWWALAGDQPEDAEAYAAEAADAACSSGDPAMQLLADAAVAAVATMAEPTQPNLDAFFELARRRTEALTYPRLSDEPDVVALADRLRLANR